MEEQGLGLVKLLETQEEDVVLLTAGEHKKAVEKLPPGFCAVGVDDASLLLCV